MQQQEMYGQEEYGDEMDPNQMIEEQEGDGSNALNLKWVIGFNKHID